VIEGTLVNLRAREVTDRDRMARWINDPEVTRFHATRYPWSLAAEEAFLRDRTAQPPGYADVSLAIETTEGEHIGSCGLHGVTYEGRNAELGIMVGERAYWDRGYGSDAVRTLVRFGFDEMNLHRVWLRVFAFNERGIRSYTKCGFVEEGRLREQTWLEGRYWDQVVMGILRDDWLAAQPEP
jgi:RimJ/RimL family protein N-acetyltransferase